MDEEKNENNKQTDDMPSRSRRIRIAGAVYIALAVCVVTVMVLSVYSVSVPAPEDINISIPEISQPRIELPGGETSKPFEEVPVSNEQSRVPADTQGDKQTSAPQYYRPAKGKVAKGYRMTSLVYSATLKDYRTHSGVDIEGKIGDAVVCYSDGTVKAVRTDPLMGVTIEIEHEYGLVSVYQNLSSEIPSAVKVGAKVKGGDVIGSIGDTAAAECADGPHLHFELLLEGDCIDAEKELARIK